MKTLYLHIGGGKTGSSAIQNYLELNVDALEKYGIAYLNRVNITSPYEITSGNGIPLVNSLTQGKSDAEIKNLIKSYIGKNESGICSSEFLSLLNTDNFITIIKNAMDINVEVKIIIYIRDIIPFFLSKYDQAIKRHGEHRPFKKFVLTSDYDHFTTLKSLNKINGIIDSSECIKVIHYETSKNDLIGSFLGTLGINITDSHKSEEKIIVNRSLTQQERSAIRAINRISGELYSTTISNLLISKNPNIPSESIKLDCKTLDYLRIRFQDQVSWINKHYFNGECIVKINQDSAIITEKTYKYSSRKSIHNTISEWCNKEKKAIHDIKIFAITAEKNKQKNKHLLPEDFDCIDYLIINRDVFLAGVDPVDHYLRSGMIEGRQYKIKNNS